MNLWLVDDQFGLIDELIDEDCICLIGCDTLIILIYDFINVH